MAQDLKSLSLYLFGAAREILVEHMNDNRTPMEHQHFTLPGCIKV